MPETNETQSTNQSRQQGTFQAERKCSTGIGTNWSPHAATGWVAFSTMNVNLLHLSCSVSVQPTAVISSLFQKIFTVFYIFILKLKEEKRKHCHHKRFQQNRAILPKKMKEVRWGVEHEEVFFWGGGRGKRLVLRWNVLGCSQLYAQNAVFHRFCHGMRTRESITAARRTRSYEEERDVQVPYHTDNKYTLKRICRRLAWNLEVSSYYFPKQVNVLSLFM